MPANGPWKPAPASVTTGQPNVRYSASERLALISSVPTCGRSASSAQATSGLSLSVTRPLSRPPIRRPSPPESTAPVMLSGCSSGMGHSAAKAFVVDETGERLAGRAIGTFRIGAQSQLARAAGARIDQQQLALQRLAEAEDQLEHFQRLEHADQPRHHTEH